MGLLVLRRHVISSEWCRTEIDRESFAPDRDGPILRQIRVSAQGVILVTDVPLHCSQIDEGSALHGLGVFCIINRDQVDMNIRPIRGPKVSESKNAAPVSKAVNSCSACGRVHYPREGSRLNNLRGRGGCFWESLIDSPINDQSLRPEGVPTSEQCNSKNSEYEFPFRHLHLSFELKC